MTKLIDFMLKMVLIVSVIMCNVCIWTNLLLTKEQQEHIAEIVYADATESVEELDNDIFFSFEGVSGVDGNGDSFIMDNEGRMIYEPDNYDFAVFSVVKPIKQSSTVIIYEKEYTVDIDCISISENENEGITISYNNGEEKRIYDNDGVVWDLFLFICNRKY